VTFTDNINNLFVGEVASRYEESLAACVRDFNSLDVRECYIADIDPEENAGRGNLILHPTLNNVHHPLVRGIDGLEGVQVVNYGTKHQRRIDSSDIEVWLLLLNKVPGGLLGKGLAGDIGQSREFGYDGERWLTLLAR